MGMVCMKRMRSSNRWKSVTATALSVLLAVSLSACSSANVASCGFAVSVGICASSAEWRVLSGLGKASESSLDEVLWASRQTGQELARLREKFSGNFAAIYDADGVRLSDRFEIGECLPVYRYENGAFNQRTGLYPLYNNGIPVALVSVLPQGYKPDPEMDGVSDKSAAITYYGHDANFKEALKSSRCLVLFFPEGFLDENGEASEYIVNDSLNSFEITSWNPSSEDAESRSSELPGCLKDEVSQLQMMGTTLRMPVVLASESEVEQ